ncbi:hypothetical protein VN97_g9967 [Penicillium thymicola]|uniref:Uncharacterized protein n=1 Tax=Penicillium thymicola TaxID=293382 RepID=A0AAI9T9V3_PENTH|nr:hypothetical protein VN97_g9967 [Penicillium thymicola]
MAWYARPGEGLTLLVFFFLSSFFFFFFFFFFSLLSMLYSVLRAPYTEKNIQVGPLSLPFIFFFSSSRVSGPAGPIYPLYRPSLS